MFNFKFTFTYVYFVEFVINYEKENYILKLVSFIVFLLLIILYPSM